jgi:hypothetical protein
MTRRFRIQLPAAVAVALVVAGCGIGPGAGSDDPVGLSVTRDFGRAVVVPPSSAKAPSSETVMRMLQRRVPGVTTRYGGGFVQSIGGLGGGTERGRQVDWFYFVNGSEARKGAAATKVRGGDQVWWDRRVWDAAESVPAVVGSFPEPFLHGPGTAKRLPVRVECIDPESAACGAVEDRLVGLGVPASRGTLRASFTQDTLRVLVGPWIAVSEDDALLRIEDGPGASGVYAQPRDGGRGLTLLDTAGHPVRTLGAGAGLIAATAVRDQPPIWVVSGTDAAGVEAAARAFRREDLRGRFAVAVDGGTVVPLPVQGAAR